MVGVSVRMVVEVGIGVFEPVTVEVAVVVGVIVVFWGGANCRTMNPRQ
jgi:hypothetical protein